MFGPPTIAWGFRSVPISIVPNLQAQVCLVLVTAGVVGIVRFGERRPIETILGSRPDAFGDVSGDGSADGVSFDDTSPVAVNIGEGNGPRRSAATLNLGRSAWSIS
jgi:hypothetical protein